MLQIISRALQVIYPLFLVSEFSLKAFKLSAEILLRSPLPFQL